MENLKNKSVLIFDHGLQTELAVRLARDFGEVKYYVPWEAAFPKSSLSIIGDGLEGVKRVSSFWDNVDDADLIVFPDTYLGDKAEYLVKHGKRVFGPCRSEILENNRWKTKQLMKKVGLPLQHCVKIKGFESLIEYLKKHDNVVVKLNTFRGDCETFIHDTYDTTQAQYLGDLLNKVGAKADILEFVIEDKIEGIEPGYDGFVVDGNYSNIAMWGYEKKGTGYIGKIDKNNNLPPSMKLINDKLAPALKAGHGRTFMSTELIVTKDQNGYLIDPTIRVAMPCVGAIQLEIFNNISEFIWFASGGKIIDLKANAKYGVGISIDSDWAEKHWTEIGFEQKYRQWIKLRMACRLNGKYYALPGFTSVCSVIGTGNDIPKIINGIKKIAETLKIKESTYTISGLEDIYNKTIPEGRRFGLEF